MESPSLQEDSGAARINVHASMSFVFGVALRTLLFHWCGLLLQRQEVCSHIFWTQCLGVLQDVFSRLLLNRDRLLFSSLSCAQHG